MTQINIRIPQELKTKAMQKAQAEGLSISTLIVQFLQSYTDGELELKIVRKAPDFSEGIIQV
jgi:antitoxin component of RelBE/YafQ-DinJ toxin-antitoxin module